MTAEPDQATRPPEPADVEDEVGYEQDLGETERGAAANRLLRSLARAARAYLLYDPRNEAIQAFLRDLSEQFTAWRERFGDLPLAVRPFELVLDGEVVYLERDRERSLAFKLFRDGVRFLTVSEGVEWHEVLTLLEILSIRYTGIRQNEDDMVTLLWKAGFDHVDIEAVEGFVPEDEATEVGSPVPGGEAGQEGAEGPRMQVVKQVADVRVPPDFDLPQPDLPGHTRARWRPVDREAKEALLAEDGSACLADDCLHLVSELFKAAANPTDPLEPGELTSLLVEIRDFLLADGQLPALLDLLDDVDDFARRCEEGAELAEELRRGLDEPASLYRVVRTIPADGEPLPEFHELLGRIQGDPLERMVALLVEHRSDHDRAVLRSLIARYARDRARDLVPHIANNVGPVAADLLRSLYEADPSSAREIVLELAGRQELELRYVCLQIISELPHDQAMRSLLFHFLQAPEEDVRSRAIAILTRQRDRRDFPLLRRHARQGAATGMERGEAEAVGRALSWLDPRAAMECFRDWAGGKGLLSRLRMEHGPLEWAALAGLAEIDGEEAGVLIDRMAARARTEDFEKACIRARVFRRHRAQALENR